MFRTLLVVVALVLVCSIQAAAQSYPTVPNVPWFWFSDASNHFENTVYNGHQPIYNPGGADVYSGTNKVTLNSFTTGWMRIADNSTSQKWIRQAYTQNEDPSKVGWMDGVNAVTISMSLRFNSLHSTNASPLVPPGKDQAVTFLKAVNSLNGVGNSASNKSAIEWKVYADTTAGLIHIWNSDANWDWLYGGARAFRLHQVAYANPTDPNLVHNKFWITADDPDNTTLFGEYNTYGKVGDTAMMFGFDSTTFNSTYFYDYVGYAFGAYDINGNELVPVPEPSSLMALGGSFVGLLGFAFRKRS